MLTAVAAAAFAVVGIVSILTRPSEFSLGVGAMLVIYAALVGAVAWLCWRRVSLASGTVVAAGLLHTLVLGSFVTSGHTPWLALLLPIPIATVVAGVLPSYRRAFESGEPEVS